VRSVCIPDVVTIIVLRVPYQGGWTVFQVRDAVVAEPELVAIGGFGEEHSLRGCVADGSGGFGGGGCWG